MGSTTNAGLAIAVIALLLGGFAFVRADAPQVMSSVNNIGAVTLATFSSLNMTTVGNTITLGINLAHANIWTATQTFRDILPSASNTYNFGSASKLWTQVYTFDVGAVATSLIDFANSASAPISVFTPNAAGTQGIMRLQFGGGAAQGSAGITTFESLLAGLGTLDIGSLGTPFANIYATTLHGALSWASLTSFPSACAAGSYLNAVGSTLTCVPLFASITNSGEVTGTTTATTISSVTIDHNYIDHAGDGFMAYFGGRFTAGGAPATYTVQVKLGSTLLTQATCASHYRGLITFNNYNGTGTNFVTLTTWCQGTVGDFGSSTLTVDTTSDQTLAVIVTLGNSGDKVTNYQLAVSYMPAH